MDTHLEVSKTKQHVRHLKENKLNKKMEGTGFMLISFLQQYMF